jgi:hypothetical protein
VGRDRENAIGERAMTEETTRAAVTDLYSAYAGGDGERMAALIADDVDFIIYGYLSSMGISVCRPPPGIVAACRLSRRHVID